MKTRPLKKLSGFTLIELSIVFVIIGLIVGGVLLGRNLIAQAEVRAQITQIEKYNSAVNTFRSKFNAIPGDMTPTTAQQFGFTVGASCDGSFGHRDGNGVIDSVNGGGSNGVNQMNGETTLFWQDLSSTVGGNLIDGTFPNSGATIYCGSSSIYNLTPGTTFIGDFLPVGKIGHSTFINVYEYSGANWYGLAATAATNVNGLITTSSATIPVSEAYSIDNKVDDGLPGTGNVQAVYINNNNTTPANAPNAVTVGGNSTSCYDSTTGTYSVTYNNGNGANCALSFKFQ